MPLAQESKGFLRAVGEGRTKTTKGWEQSPIHTVNSLGLNPSLPVLSQSTSLLKALEISFVLLVPQEGKSGKWGKA